jgi:signal transduction histidine kinase
VHIVDGLLSFAKAGARPEPGAVSEVRPVLDDALSGLAEQAAAAGVTFHAEGISDCEVACHPGVLASLLSNLMVNAIKYMGDSAQRRITLRTKAVGQIVHFEVEDTGPGIPPQLLERVFEPYVRLGQDGAGIGLGLATVRKLCVAHGGRVGLRSEVGQGSVFWFELPSPWEVNASASAPKQPAHP